MSFLKMNFPLSSDAVIAQTATTTSQRYALGNSGGDVMIDNPGPNDIYVRTGDATVVATLSSMRIQAGEKSAYFRGTNSHLAVITAANTQAFTVFTGQGE